MRRTIGYVPQETGVDRLRDRPREPAAPGARAGHGRPGPAGARRRAARARRHPDAADRIVKGYSGGMKRRLRHRARPRPPAAVLFLDEPTTGLDPEARVAMWVEVGGSPAGGADDLLTTHYLEEADQLADRLAIVSQGKIVVEGRPSELKASLPATLVHVELDDGERGRAGESIAAAGRDRRARSLEGRTSSPASRTAAGAPGDPRALDAARHRGRIGDRRRARRWTTSTSTTPAATSRPRTRGWR